MKANCIRYIATDFHVDRFSSVFKTQLQSWSTDFGFFPTGNLVVELRLSLVELCLKN